MRIEPVRRRMSTIIDDEIRYASGPIGDETRSVVDSLTDGEVAMLENLRFDPGEEANEPAFSNSLASLADIFVNDAFGASHRSHASIVGVASLLPTYAGLLMRDEIAALNRAVESDEHPAVAILGGAKVADKLGVVKNLAPNVDAVLIGGGMVSTMFTAMGKSAGSAEISDDELCAARELFADDLVAEKLRLPNDVVVAEEFSESSASRQWDVEKMPDRGVILDIGSETAAMYAELIGAAKKLIWNGPMGLFEWPRFARGTAAVAEAISANSEAFKLAGGGSTVEAINSFGITNQLTHISTGGGASLEYLEGKALPGIAALQPC